MGGTKEKTYVTLSTEKLMDNPSDYYKSIEREYMKNIKSGIKSVNKRYKKAIVDSRGLFNEGYLTKVGFNPNENIQYTALDSDLLLAWCKQNINQSIESISYVKSEVLNYEDIVFKNAQLAYGSNFSYLAKTITIDNKEYIYDSCVANGNLIESTFTVNKNITAENYRLVNFPNLTISGSADYNNAIKILFSDGSTKIVEYERLHLSYPNESFMRINEIVDRYNSNNTYSFTYSIDESPVSCSAIYKIIFNIGSNGEISYVIKEISRSIYNSYYGDVFYSTINDLITADGNEKAKKLLKDITKEILDIDDYFNFTYKLNGHEYFTYINKVQHPDLLTVKNYNSYPIIPLKKNNAFYSDSNKKFKSVINKLGINAKEFQAQLSDSKISEVFIGYNIRMNATDSVSVRYIYDFLDQLIIQEMVNGKTTYSGNHVSISFSGQSVDTTLHCSKKIFPGNIPGGTGTLGEYLTYLNTYTEVVKDIDSEGSQISQTISNKCFAKQVNENYYEIIEVLGAKTTVSSGGYSTSNSYGSLGHSFFNKYGTSRLEEIMIPLVKDLIKKYNQKDFCFILASSINLFIIAVQVVKIKWYQSGFWKFVFIVAGAVLAFLGGGVPGLIIYMLITIAVESGLLKGTALKIVMIVYAIYNFANAYTNYNGFQSTLTMANSMVQISSIAQQINNEGVINHARKELESAQERNEETQKKMEELDRTIQDGIWIGISDREPDMLYLLSSTDFMCNNDILYDIDNSIEKIYPPE